MANALLDDSTQDLGEASGKHGVSSEATRLLSSQTAPPEDVQGPLRSSPMGGQELGGSLPGHQRSNVLAPKSTNLRVQGRGSKTVSKLQISNPSPVIPDGKPVQSNVGNSVRDWTVRLSQDASESQQITTSTDAADFNKKIPKLIHQANQPDDTLAPSSHTSQNTSKASESSRGRSLRKGREVLVRAKRAISERLSVSEDRKLGHNTVGDSGRDEFNVVPYKIEENSSRQRLSRRIAEGENLSNPKIRALTGDGNFPRKPLPVYESMTSLRRQSSSSDDPFSDDVGSNDTSLSHKLDTFDVDFSGGKGDRSSTMEPLLPRQHQSSSQERNDTSMMSRSRPIPRYSPSRSGLTQHPDIEFFSSSPVGFSTPRVRLEPLVSTSGKKRLSTVSARSPSILDFSFERLSDDDTDELQRVPDRARSPTLSLKRKTGRANLRSGLSPAPKKTKSTDLQEASLRSGLAKLEASGNGSLTVRDAYKKLKNATSTGSKTKGLKIFDVCKGQEPKREIRDDAKKSNNLSTGTQSSDLRPAVRHTRGQRSRSAISLGSTIHEETMSIDELQMDRNVGVKD